MKDRQKKILRFMLLNKGSLHIEDIAGTFSIGKRTVSRDLDTIERWLSFRGAGLERKPRQGIRVLTFGKSVDEFIKQINKPEKYLESLDAEQRQILILLYLLFNNREIKISSIANAFYISDTSVWSDLNQIEESIAGSDLQIERMKGVGIRLTGTESSVRLKFLAAMAGTFSSNTIIPYLYSVKEDSGAFLEINQLKFLINRLNFPGNNTDIFEIISNLVGEVGYQFTMSGESLLYFYLQMSVHRIKTGALIHKTDFTECSPFFYNLAKSALDQLTSRIFNGRLPEGEYRFLGLLMQVLEPGDINKVDVEKLFSGMITEQIMSFTNELISEFGRLDNRQYYLNEQIESVLCVSAAALITRLKNGIPYWHGEWGETSAENWNRKNKLELLSGLMVKHFNIEADFRELDNILLYFHSMIFSHGDLPDKKIRTLLCCFEGIGLAAYLRSVLNREIDSINIIEATAVFRIKQEYLDANGIELVISTFPINDLELPVIPVSLPINKPLLVSQIEAGVFEVKRRKKADDNTNESVSVPEENRRVSFGKIISFVNRFQFIEMPVSGELDVIISALPKYLELEIHDPKKLADDIRKREALGPLIVEEWGLRILHCKSDAVSEPVAGVIDFAGEGSARMLFMIAPDPCPDDERLMLSTITISFMDNAAFRNAVLSSSVDDLKKQLMLIYQE